MSFSASAKFPKEKFSQDGNEPAAASSSSQDEFKNLQLNSSEELYQDLRDLNFNSVPATLSTFIKTISQEQEVYLKFIWDPKLVQLYYFRNVTRPRRCTK